MAPLVRQEELDQKVNLVISSELDQEEDRKVNLVAMAHPVLMVLKESQDSPVWLVPLVKMESMAKLAILVCLELQESHPEVVEENEEKEVLLVDQGQMVNVVFLEMTA